MQLILPTIYAAIIAIWLWRSNLLKLQAAPPWLLTAIFAVKCAMGMLYLWVHQHYYGGGDTWLYLRDGQIVYDTLFNDPLKYLQLTFGPNNLPEVPTNILKEVDLMGFWFDSGAYLVVRFVALVLVVSFGNIYGCVLAMALLSTCGLYWLYQAATSIARPSYWLLLAAFGLPSVLFWTSGVHKDGLLLFFLGGFILATYRIFQGNNHPKYWAGAVVSLLFMYILRDFVFFLLIPPVVAAFVSKRIPRYSWAVFLGIYGIIISTGSFIPIDGHANFLEVISNKQVQFKSLEAGNTQIEMLNFQPNLLSLIKYLPQALYNVFVGPMKFWGGNPFYKWVFLENAAILLLLAIGTMGKHFRSFFQSPFTLLLFSFSLSLLILIGYTVPNVGAIVRYRSVALPILLLALFMHFRNKPNDLSMAKNNNPDH